MTRTLFKRMRIYFKNGEFFFDRFSIEEELQSIDAKEAIDRIDQAIEDMESTIRIVEGKHRLGMAG